MIETKPNPFPCPRCGKQLEATGTVSTDDGPETPVYQCDTCFVRVDFAGKSAEVNLTFCVNEEGKPFDPASPDGTLAPAVDRPTTQPE